MANKRRRSRTRAVPQLPTRPRVGRHVALAGIVVVLLGLALYFGSHRAGPTGRSDSTASPAGALGERADYRIKGDTVHVNNRLCAVSRSPLANETIGRFQSRVRYDGPVEAFRGKTLVFNQCCEMCEERFPAQWASARDETLRFHGLIP